MINQKEKKSTVGQIQQSEEKLTDVEWGLYHHSFPGNLSLPIKGSLSSDELYQLLRNFLNDVGSSSVGVSYSSFMASAEVSLSSLSPSLRMDSAVEVASEVLDLDAGGFYDAGVGGYIGPDPLARRFVRTYVRRWRRGVSSDSLRLMDGSVDASDPYSVFVA